MNDDELARVAEERWAKYEWASESGNHAFIATVDVEDEWHVLKIDKLDLKVRIPRVEAAVPEARKERNMVFETSAREAIREADPSTANDVPVMLMYSSGFVTAELDRRFRAAE